MGRHRVLTALLLTAAFGQTWVAEAQSPEKFDVVCAGTSVETNPGKAATQPWTARISIDLTAAKYCPGDGTARCDAPLPIKAIEPHRLLLSESWMVPDPRYPYVKEGGDMEISRSDGSLKSHLVILDITNRTVEAKCTVDTFTPFPSTLF
jgi:hypothetical protein